MLNKWDYGDMYCFNEMEILCADISLLMIFSWAPFLDSFLGPSKKGIAFSEIRLYPLPSQPFLQIQFTPLLLKPQDTYTSRKNITSNTILSSQLNNLCPNTTLSRYMYIEKWSLILCEKLIQFWMKIVLKVKKIIKKPSRKTSKKPKPNQPNKNPLNSHCY